MKPNLNPLNPDFYFGLHQLSHTHIDNILGVGTDTKNKNAHQS